MKVKCARLYQAVPIGAYLETFLTTLPGNKHSGLTLEWVNGLLKIEAKALTGPRFIPSANIMYMDFEEPEAKAPKAK